MATTSLNVAARPRRLGRLLALAGLCLSGCVTLPEWTTRKETAPTGVVHEVHSDWEPRIVVTRDSESNGAPLQGLAGRVYLFDAGFHPIRGNGALDFVVYDISKPGEPVWINAWSYDKDTLNSQLLRKDEGITWGYTVFLPCEKLNNKMSRLEVKVRYRPDTGAPLFAPVATVNLNSEARATVRIQQSVVTPAAQTKK